MKLRQTIVLSALTALTAVSLSSAVYAAPTVPNRPQTTMTEITTRDFTTFKVPESVKLYHVSFSNQYGMEVVGYLFVPKDLKGKAKAIVIGHPMGASKEQAASNYGAALAEHGFVTLAVDQQFWGESSGYPRHAISPDLYAEAFSAAVDFLGTRNFVNRNKIGILGICGSGSFVISAAKIDPRMKAVATVSMYNIGEMRRSGIRNSVSLEQRKKVIADAAEQRYSDFTGGDQVLVGGSPFKVDEKSPATRQHSYALYRDRGKFIPKGEKWEENTRSDKASNVKFMNFYPFNDIETISPRPMMFVMGEKAHSRPFTQDAYAKAAEPKKLVEVKGAGHFDLYDKPEYMPINQLVEFFDKSLN